MRLVKRMRKIVVCPLLLYGQFLLCNSGGRIGLTEGQNGDLDHGLIGITLNFDDSGQINAGTKISIQVPSMHGYVPNTYLGWDDLGNHAIWDPMKTYKQDIQSASSAVLLDYDGEQYAIVSDFNFWFNDPLVANDLTDTPRTQIGGKIGIVQNPFGLNGRPPVYLGATTPIAGGAVTKLTLSKEGTLFANVWNYQTNYDPGAEVTFSLYVWDAPKLIQGALQAYERDSIRRYPIDRNLPANPRSPIAPSLIPEMAPLRYDEAGNGSKFDWPMAMGSYTMLGEFPQFGKTEVPPAAYKVTPLEPPASIMDGFEGDFKALGYVVGGMNLLTGGYMERAGQRMYKFQTGQITDYDQMVYDNLIDFAATTAAFVVSGGGRI